MKAGLKVIKCIVEQKESWAGSSHPYKQSAFLKVKGVPTVLLVQGGKQILLRAETDADLQNSELLRTIAKHEN